MSSDSTEKKSSGSGKDDEKSGKKLDPASPISTITRTSNGFTATSTSTSCSSNSCESVSSWVSVKSSLKPAKKSDSNPKTRSDKRSVKFSTPPPHNRGTGSNRSDSPHSQSAGGATPKRVKPYPTAASPKKANGATAKRGAAKPLPEWPDSKNPIMGNIWPHGTYLPLVANTPPPKKVLNPGNRNYGYGTVVRSSLSSPEKEVYIDPEELRKSGDDSYNKGDFIEALSYYEKAIAISPANPAYRLDRSNALLGLNRIVDAAEACKEVIRIDPQHVMAHHRLGSILLSLGDVDNARGHICFPGGQKPYLNNLEKLQSLEQHMINLANFRRDGDWINVLWEINSAVSSGVDASPQIFACRAEALLNMHRLNHAVSIISSIPSNATTLSDSKMFGMVSDSYISFVRSKIELAGGNFDAAVSAIEKAQDKDPCSVEIAAMAKNIKTVTRARNLGNELFKIQKFSEACSAYGDGIRMDPRNAVLYCNRAACWYKLGLFERSVEDCDQALSFQPKYSKALLRRAAAYLKLERWNQAVYDYNLLIREHPDDGDIAESLFHAEVWLKKSLGEDVSYMKWGGAVESVDSLDEFKAAIQSQSASVVLFGTSSNHECQKISPFFDAMCAKYPAMNFYKVDTEKTEAVVEAEKVKAVPTVKIYKRGKKVKEMFSPTADFLESSIKQCSCIG